MNKNEASLKLEELTLLVGDECPVAKSFGGDGIGEGIVWKCVTPGYESSDFWFKTKDPRHSASKVKTLAPVDIEKLASVTAFVEATVTTNRLEQAWAEVEHGSDRKGTGDFIRWVIKDILSEEADTMAFNNLGAKDIGGSISKVAKNYFFAKLDEL